MKVQVDLNLLSNRAMDSLREDLHTRTREASEALTRHMRSRFKGVNYYRKFDKLDQERQRLLREARAFEELMRVLED